MKKIDQEELVPGSSSIYFKDGRVIHANNDGMELLGHFLLSQVGANRTHFFTKWLIDSEDEAITSGPYFIEKMGDQVSIDHLQNERAMPFITSRKNLMDILKHWYGFCKSDQHSVCKVGGYDVTLSRSVDGDGFVFHSHDTH